MVRCLLDVVFYCSEQSNFDDVPILVTDNGLEVFMLQLDWLEADQVQRLRLAGLRFNLRVEVLISYK